MKRIVAILVHQLLPHESRKAETRTEKLWHTSPQTYLLGYKVSAD